MSLGCLRHRTALHTSGFVVASCFSCLVLPTCQLSQNLSRRGPVTTAQFRVVAGRQGGTLRALRSTCRVSGIAHVDTCMRMRAVVRNQSQGRCFAKSTKIFFDEIFEFATLAFDRRFAIAMKFLGGGDASQLAFDRSRVRIAVANRGHAFQRNES